ASGTAFTEPLTATLTSRCVENEDSELDPSTTFVDGSASARYTSVRCRPSDIITATLNYGGTTFTAFGELIIDDGNSLPDGSTVSVAMTSEDSSDNTIRADAPGSITAAVLDNDNNPVANVIVAFTTPSLATFNPTSGLVLTDTNGQTNIEMLAGNTAGADTLTITVESSLTTTLNYAVASPEIKIGNGSAGSFTNSTLDVNVNPLSAGGTTTVTATIVDGSNALYTSPLDISFSSNCVSSGLASIDASITTINGSAQTTYRATGCEGVDTITASANLGGAAFTATGTLTVNSDSAGSLEFVSATPSELAIAGTGGQGLSEQSTVIFRARGSQGLALANQTINFSLTSSMGGLSFSPTSATTDSDGLAFTVVRSGTVATAVGVVAQIAGTAIATQSDLLTVSTGVPDQNSFGFSASTYNLEGWDIDGTIATLSVYLADYYNNPVPDGTAVTFTAEGGSVESTCSTTSGSCNAQWTAQAPRPSDGRVTLLVSAIGNESFADNNGNGVFDDGDTLGTNDLAEAFLDINDSATRDPGESFIDFNNNSAYDSADGLYNGTPCEHSTDCGLTSNTAIRNSIVLTMSGSYPVMVVTTTGGVGGTPIGTVYALSETVSDTITIAATNFISFNISISDENGNRLPAETSITLNSNNGELLGPDSVTVPNVADTAATPTLISVRLNNDGAPSTDLFNIIVTTPSGISTTQSIYVTDL
ncbi:MAG: hypothetical protein JKY67_21620, partial [Pseudomonadales bacterium]|nr:hypothetical protein [Pseudomonadales bacterium]